MDAFRVGDMQTARLVAQQVVEQFPNNPWQKRSLFLMGRAFIALDMPFEAEAIMLRVDSEYPELADYGLYILAEYFFSKSRHADAAKLYQRLLDRHPKSLLAGRASLRKAQALFEAGDFARAAEAFEEFLDEYPRSESAAEAGVGLGRALAAQEKFDRAVRALREVCVKYPGSPADEDLRRAFVDLAGRGAEIPEPTPDELFERGKNLLRIKEYQTAYGAFTRLLEVEPDYPQKADVLLRSGIALFHLGRRPEASAVLERMLREHPAHPSGAEALNWLARIYGRLGRKDDAIVTFLKIIESYPDSRWADDALFLVGNIYRESDNVAKALQFYDRLVKERPTSKYADSAWWWKAWASYTAGDYTKADRTLQDLINTYPRSFLVKQAQYWRGRIAERRGDQKQAAAHYGLVMKTAPYTYYGYRAADRLAALKMPAVAAEPAALPVEESPAAEDVPEEEPAEDVGPPVWTDETAHALSSDPAYTKTFELMTLAMKKEAAAELWSLKARISKKRGALLGLSKAFFELGDYHRSLLLVLRNYERYLDGPVRETPEDFWLLAYPQGYWDSIIAYARKYGTDPYFVASIIHAESQFHAEALSPAGARGVMQVMPATGQWAAQTIRLSGFDRDKLFDPDTSINIGTWYLSFLLKRFRGDPLLVAAAYNAGPDAVAGWLGKNGNGAERETFVESIPFSETRGYVKKVMRNYAEYLRIYGRSTEERGLSHLFSEPPDEGIAFDNRMGHP
jgi:soluble lytic murein transglycosylase